MKASDMVISFIGPSGCGKKTQSGLLREKFKFAYIGSGDLLRQRAQDKDFTGRKIKTTINEGRLVPSLVIATLWEREMERVKNLPQFPGLIIDGSPRVLSEAKLIDSGLQWYGWDSRHKIIYLNIGYEESKKRLLTKKVRQRKDDNLSDLKKRWSWFREKTLPVIEYYKQKGLLVEIEGEAPIAKIHQSIVRALKLE